MDLTNLPTLPRDTFAQDAKDTFRWEGPRVAGDPILVATDVTSQGCLPDLVPAEWRPALSHMIMRAVERRDWVARGTA